MRAHARTTAPMRRLNAFNLVALVVVTASVGCHKNKEQRTPRLAPNVVQVQHAQLSATEVRPVRREQKRDVWIRVLDANRLIYTYAPVGTQLAEDRQAREDFQKMLGGMPARDTSLTARGDSGRTAKDTAAVRKEREFQNFAEGILILRDSIRRNLLFTDTATGSSAATIEKGKQNVEAAASRLLPFVDDTATAVTQLQTLYGALDSLAKTRNSPLLAAARLAAPATVRWRGEFLRAVGGPEEIHYEYPGTGEYLVELSVGNRLGDAYRPARWVGTGADVILTKPKFRPFQVSFGLGGLRGDRVEAELVKVSRDSATVDTFEVRSRKVGKLSLLPSTFFSFQHGFGQTPWTVGATLGIGLRGDDTENVGQATDLMALATFGYEWVRVSIGGAYTSEITGFNGTFRGQNADSLRTFTTDPNALQRTDRTRTRRLVVALHMTR